MKKQVFIAATCGMLNSEALAEIFTYAPKALEKAGYDLRYTSPHWSDTKVNLISSDAVLLRYTSVSALCDLQMHLAFTHDVPVFLWIPEGHLYIPFTAKEYQRILGPYVSEEFAVQAILLKLDS